MRKMTRIKRCAWIFMFICLALGGLTTRAADNRIGTVVDGSLLVQGKNSVESVPAFSVGRGTYLSSGSGKLTIKGTHYVNVFGSTDCNRTCDEVKVTLHLQRLTGNTWTTVYTLPTKTAKNASYVSNSQNYTITGGYYYRVKGSHTAKKGTTTETTASYTDGLWID